MKTRDEIIAIIARFNGAQLTASQIQKHLTKRVGTVTINWHINRLIAQGILEPITRKPNNQGNVLKVKT